MTKYAKYNKHIWITFSFIFLFALQLSAQYTVVIKEKGTLKPIPNLEVELAGIKKTTNHKGEILLVGVSAQDIQNKPRRYPKGYSQFNYAGKPGKIIIILEKRFIELKGKVICKPDNTYIGKKINLKNLNSLNNPSIQKDGTFLFRIEERFKRLITDKVVFLIPKKAVGNDYYTFDKKNNFYTINLSNENLASTKVIFILPDNKSLLNYNVKIGGQNFKTSPQGAIDFQSVDIESKPIIVEGFEITQRILDSRDTYLVYLKKSEVLVSSTDDDNSSGDDTEVLDDTSDGGFEDFDGSSSGSDDELDDDDYSGTDEGVNIGGSTIDSMIKKPIKQFEKDLAIVITELDEHKQVLTERITRINEEMESIHKKLSSTTLTEKEREYLQGQFKKLEKKFIDTNLAYEQAREQTEAVISKLSNDLNAKNDLIKRNEANIFVFIIIALVLAVCTFIFLLLARRFKKHSEELKELNTKLQTTQDELVDKVQEVEKQHQAMEEQASSLQVLNTELVTKTQKITDSIRYAQKIQSAILPRREAMKEVFSDLFVIYLSKDLVSGDFYWFLNVKSTDGRSLSFVAAVDCTGHGVPGGFMSMIGNALLNQIVHQKKIYNPAVILEMLNTGVQNALQQEEKRNDDGMDISLCCIEKDEEGNAHITFSGAKRPIYYIRKEDEEMQILKGDNKTIGGIKRSKKNFSTIEFDLMKGDLLYLCSDGIADQHNSKRKKFGSRRLISLLEGNKDKSLLKQREIVLSDLQNFQGDMEQRDDILVLGLQI